jgi:hypothetical protein
VFLVAWTGGLEQPSFAAFATDEQAMDRATEWRANMTEPGDRVDVLCVWEHTGVAIDGEPALGSERGTLPVEVIATFAYQGA